MITLDLQMAVPEADQETDGVPAWNRFEGWAEAALRDHPGAELTVRVVGRDEIAELNRGFRGKEGPTNVLSFPFEAPPGVETPLLGDVVICAAVVAGEAATQGKDLEAHWAHMVVHGCLHLLGYDHMEPDEAEQMEALEREILGRLGYPDPYAAERAGEGTLG